MAKLIARGRAGAQWQRGAVAILVAFAILMLLAALGLVIDLGHLYVVKTELQNAADACALAAVSEISPYDAANGGRAIAAGIAVGTKNKIDFQSNDVVIGAGDVTFGDTADGPFSSNYLPTTRYVRCIPEGPTGRSVVMWIMQLWGTQSSSVTASATAGMRLGVFPLAVCTEHPEINQSAINQAAINQAANDIYLGLTVGHWYGGRLEPGKAFTGSYDWIRVSGLSGARALADLVAGYGDFSLPEEGALIDSEPGVDQSVARAWNTRFGLYAAPYQDKQSYRPDFTGWGYTGDPLAKCPRCDFATDPSACWNAFDDYRMKQRNFIPFDYCAISRNLPGNPSPLSSDDHKPPPIGLGLADRRLVVNPIIKCSDWAPNKRDILVQGWACSLMLAPISDSDVVRFEFLGLARNSPCAAAGNPRLVR
ncbi:MAG: hypothetical protein EPO27_21135 [Betaproteobacteria bacterium]|nr:MAG: hypothetical protein EPO27_21135 [Betaproteobacteria bacterium]